jgi:hypothetical protein
MPRGNDVRRWGRLHGGHQRPWRAPVAWMRWAVSRGQLVVKDRSSERRSPTKAGGGAVQAESGAVQSLSVADGGQGHRGGGREGGGAVHGRRREERVKRGMGGSRCLLW